MSYPSVSSRHYPSLSPMAKRLLVRRGTSKRLPRKESIRLTLNEREFKAICDHCAEHHISDRIRELVISNILIESERNAPDLFDLAR